MKCPCGCGKTVGHNRYWATEECGKQARKQGLYMPMNGTWRERARLMRKVKQARKHGRQL